MPPRFRLGVVAAEPSGDRLGGGLVSALLEREPSLELRGIGGPELGALGLSWGLKTCSGNFQTPSKSEKA